MPGMDKRPDPLPEGRLISIAQKRARLSGREAARRAQLSEGRWRQITNGYVTHSAGVYLTVKGPAATVARMAHVVGLTPQQLAEAGREDAAEELTQLIDAGAAANHGEDDLDRRIADLKADPRKRRQLERALDL